MEPQSKTLAEYDSRLQAARIRRAELLAYGKNNAALNAVNAHIDRILEERLTLTRRLNAELEEQLFT